MYRVIWELIFFTTVVAPILANFVINPLFWQDPINSPTQKSDNHIKDLRKTFINEKRKSRVALKRVKLLDRYLANNSVYIDGIVHHKIDKSNVYWKQVNAMENEFKTIIGMKGLKYTYKRDTHWRTWRSVKYPGGENRIICYRCENCDHFTKCQNIGYWTIEEKPLPCPYEVNSVINDLKLCAVHLSNYTNAKSTCSTVIEFSDLTRICDNPINTTWRIMRVFNDAVTDRFPYIICGGRESCEISTFYTINPNYVSFRIVNSTNNIIYSRLMKNGRVNYACIDDCGTMDPTTKIVSPNENPLKISLLNNKNKREDDHRYSQKNKTFLPMKTGQLKHFMNMFDSFFSIHKNTAKTQTPTCQSLSHFKRNRSDD